MFIVAFATLLIPSVIFMYLTLRFISCIYGPCLGYNDDLFFMVTAISSVTLTYLLTLAAIDFREYISTKQTQKYQDVKLRPAQKSKRIITFVVDYFFVNMLLAYAVYELFSDVFPHLLDENSLLIGLFFALFLYFYSTELLFGKTLGKMLTDTLVVSETGEKPGKRQMLKRTLARFLPFEFISLFQADRPVAWHDHVSQTLVINDVYAKATQKEQKSKKPHRS